MSDLPPILRRGSPDKSVEAVFRAFYRDDDPKPSSPEETQDEFRKRRYDNMCRAIFREALNMQNRTLDETLAQRVIVAWRAAREIARLRGLIGGDEMLNEIPDEDWDYPKDGFRPTGSTATFDSRIWEVFDDAKSEDQEGFGRMHPVRGELFGIALSPPPIPSALEGDSDYDHTLDPQFGYWLAALQHIGKYLRLNVDPKDGEGLARDGFVPLIDPQLARYAWPTQHQLEMFEEILIEEVTAKLSEEPQREVVSLLRSRYGLTQYEVDSVMKIARSSALRLGSGDVEEDRGLMVMRLEGLMKRARESFDLRTELGALKQLSIVLGLSRTERDDTMKDIMDAIAEGAKERRALQEAPPKLVENLAGPQGEIIEAEYVERND